MTLRIPVLSGILSVASVLLVFGDTPPDSPTPDLAQELSAQTGRPFATHTTDRFVIVHDAGEVFARGRGALLERTYDQFTRELTRKGFALREPASPLVCLVFGSYDDYARYAAGVDGAVSPFVGGYFSLRTNRIAFYDDRTSPQFDEMVRRLDALELELADARQRARNANATAEDREALDALIFEQRWRRNRMALIAAGSNDAKATHEAVHQLAFNTGLQDPAIEYPLWVTEGLATCFETIEPDRTFGPYRDNPARRPQLIEAHMHGRLVPLEVFVAMTQLPEDIDRDAATEIYAQCWGLFRYLYIRRNDGLREYYAALREMPQTSREPEALRECFVEAFGAIDRVERRFSQYLRTIR